MPSPAENNRFWKSAAGKTALCGILAALALIFSYIEAILPFLPGVPGIKPGLANLVIVIALYRLDARTAFLVNLLRILMSALLFTGMFGFLYSLAGCLLSFAIMLLLKRTGLFSVVGVSMAGGVFHNVGQLLVAAAAISGPQIFHYLPVLILAGTVFGTINGIICLLVLHRLP